MDPLQTRPCVYALDNYSLVGLVLAYRAATCVAVYPTAWRVRLLLSSRVWDPEQDTCIWETPSGRTAALAFLWRRQVTSPYLVLERFIHPEFISGDLACQMLAWGSRRADAILEGQSLPLSVFAQDFAPQLSLDSRYEDCGFGPLALNPDDNVYFGRSLAGDLPAPALPPGYTIRPVQGMQEMKEYQSLYSFAAVNPAFQQEELDSDEYSHLVVVDPQGRLAGYVESSICRQEWQEAGQRTGWIDYIETRADQQRRGLGEAVMWAGLRRLQEAGAESALLVTMGSNKPANRLYVKTGFRRMPNLEPPRYEKKIG